jgi:kynurenine formamidase
MRFRIFAIGYVVALGILILSQRGPLSVRHDGFARTVDLTQAVDISATYPRHGHYDQLQALAPATRIEAPAKLTPGLWTVNQIPVARLRVPLVVLNVSQQIAANSRYQIQVDDIARWERHHGEIPLGSLVIVRTDWRSESGKRSSAPSVFSEEATRFLVEGRMITGLGTDLPASTNERGASARTYASRHSVYELSRLGNLGAVPETGSLALVAPAHDPGSVETSVRVVALAE